MNKDLEDSKVIEEDADRKVIVETLVWLEQRVTLEMLVSKVTKNPCSIIHRIFVKSGINFKERKVNKDVKDRKEMLDQ